jgi:hypothetical protein
MDRRWPSRERMKRFYRGTLSGAHPGNPASMASDALLDVRLTARSVFPLRCRIRTPQRTGFGAAGFLIRGSTHVRTTVTTCHGCQLDGSE